MKFKYTNYVDGLHDIEFIESAEHLGLEEEFINNISLTCKMDKSASQIVLNCDVLFKVSFDCDRCSEKYIEVIETSFTLIKVFDEANDDPDDMNTSYIPIDITEIDLAPDVKEFIMLSLPMKKLCSEDCKGLCPRCGTNLNQNECKCKDDKINPQWNELLKLKDKLN